MEGRKPRNLKKGKKGLSLPSHSAASNLQSGALQPDPLLAELKYLNTLYENILLKMLRAKWLRYFKLTSEETWQIKWTTEGLQRVVRLKLIIESQRLAKDDLFPVGFTLLSRDGKASGEVTGMPRKDLEYWRNCCDEIGLASGLEECAMFVQIISEG